MRWMLLQLLIAVLLQSGSTIRSPRHVYISEARGSATNIGTLVKPFRTIEQALAVVEDGDTLHLASEKFVQKGNCGALINKNIVLTSTGDKEHCFLDCSNILGPALIVKTSEFSISSFTIQNSLFSAIHFESSGKFFVKHMHFTRNMGDKGGALRFSTSSFATILDCSFTHNSADIGGAIFAKCSEDQPSQLIIQGNSHGFSNHARKDGGVVFLDGCSSFIEDFRFQENTAGRNGGAFYVQHSSVHLRSVHFKSNSAVGFHSKKSHGGAVHAWQSKLLFDNIHFVSNEAIEGFGGAIFLDATELKLESSLFFRNSAMYGGSLALQGPNTHLHAISNAHNENRAFLNGGALWMTHSEADTERDEFKGNIASRGGSYFMTHGSTLKSESSYYSGGVVSVQGGGFFLTEDSTVNMYHGTVSKNNCTEPGGASIFCKRSKLNIHTSYVKNNQQPNLVCDLCQFVDQQKQCSCTKC